MYLFTNSSKSINSDLNDHLIWVLFFCCFVLFCFACLLVCLYVRQSLKGYETLWILSWLLDIFVLINSLKLVYTMQLMLCRTMRFSWVLLLWFISGSGTVLSLGLFIPHYWDKTFLSTLSMRWACQSNWYEQVLFPALCEYRDRSF